MTPPKDRIAADLPEPEDVLSGRPRDLDHEPDDVDDRDVPLDEPDTPVPPIDDDDRAV